MKQAIAITMVLCATASFVVADEKPKAAPAKEPALQKELVRRIKEEQEARKATVEWIRRNGRSGLADLTKLTKRKQAAFAKLSAKVKRLDTQNTKWLQEIVDKHGWPTVTLVGKDGADAAWLLVQHADAELKFQRRCLDLKVKLPRNEVSQSKVAYLTDRVLLAEGKKQVYGTQFALVDGKFEPSPIEDEANVDKRRAEVGLPPIEEYRKQIEKLYGGGKNK